MYLKRYHDVTISKSGVWRILKRLDMARLPASQRYKRRDLRWKRYEKDRPGHRVQVDVKFVEPLPAAAGPMPEMTPVGEQGKFYQYTAIDDCTRLRVLKIYPRNNQKTAIQFVDHVLAQLPFAVETIQTGNGAEFQSAFHWHVLDKGIQHVYIKPRTPRLNGKVERSHRIDAEEFYRLLDGVVIDDVNIFNAKLQEWQDYYNYHRPHGGLDGQTPYERLRQKTQAEAGPCANDQRRLHSDKGAGHRNHGYSSRPPTPITSGGSANWPPPWEFTTPRASAHRCSRGWPQDSSAESAAAASSSLAPDDHTRKT